MKKQGGGRSGRGCGADNDQGIGAESGVIKHHSFSPLASPRRGVADRAPTETMVR